jgi:hypothetical protein
MFLSEWREFPSMPCKKKKKLMTAGVSMLLKSRTSLSCFRDRFLTVRAKDLSAPCYSCVLSSQYLRRIFYHTSRPALWPTELPTRLVSDVICSGVKRPDCESDHLTPSSVEWVELYVYFPLYTFMACIATALPLSVPAIVTELCICL